MTFEEALAALRDGRRVRRKRWNWGPSAERATDPGGRWMQVGSNVAANADDLLATDWHVLGDADADGENDT